MFNLQNTMLALNAWGKVMNIHSRLPVPGCISPSGFACPLGGQKPQTKGLDQACGEAAQRRMRRCCDLLVALEDDRKTTGPKLTKKKSQELHSNQGTISSRETVLTLQLCHVVKTR